MSTPVDLVRATLEQAWQAECASDIYLARQVVDLRGLLAEARAREAELRTELIKIEGFRADLADRCFRQGVELRAAAKADR